MITLSDFQDIDLRIARVESVEPHPNADKLLLIKLDLGGEQKQTVAGLKEYYSTDHLVLVKLLWLKRLLMKQKRPLSGSLVQN